MRAPETTTRNDHCKVTLPWHEICNPSTDSASEASNIDIWKHEILAPATRNASFRKPPRLPTFLQPSQTPAPATHFARHRNPCACHAKNKHFEGQKTPPAPGALTSKFWRAQAWCKFWRLQLPKLLRRRQFLTILTCVSLSRAGVVQILTTSTSKTAPRPSVFNDFDLRIAVARRRGANFDDFNFQKCSEPLSS